MAAMPIWLGFFPGFSRCLLTGRAFVTRGTRMRLLKK